jgi:hypothetical protein
MSVWTELVGVRRDLRLKYKWWHHVVVGMAVISSLLVYLIVAGAIARRPVKLTASATYSLSLFRHALSREETTTIADLLKLTGTVGFTGPNGDIIPLVPASRAGTIRCEHVARYKTDEAVKVGDVTYRAIPDEVGQDPSEKRHCVAAPEYADMTASTVGVFVPDDTGRRRQDLRAFLSGIGAIFVWLILYWNVYYRGAMPFYARYRHARRRRRLEAHQAR